MSDLLPPPERPATEPSRSTGSAPIRIDRRDGVVVVTPQGALDDGIVGDLHRVLRALDDEPAIIDLDECVVLGPEAVEALALAAEARSPDLVCLACRRLSGRRLVARTGWSFATFHSVGDAIQARLMMDAGYSDGWDPQE